MQSTATLPRSSGAWHQRVWSLSWPVVVANVTLPLVGVVDTAVMGRMPDPAFLGAVAVGATIFSSIYWLFGFLRMGTTGLAAQASGARDRAELIRVALRGYSVAAAIAALVVALQLPLRALLFWVFPASVGVEDLGRLYFDIRIWGAPALMLHMVSLGVLFGTQRMRAALALSLLLNLTNVVLDLLFVLQLGWGVAGVAAATLVSEWLVAIAGLTLTFTTLGRDGAVRAALVGLWQGSQVAELFSVSSNLVVRSFFVQLPFFVFTAVGAGLGDLVLSANAVMMQFFFVMAFGLDAFAHTAETLCGYAFGARDQHGLRQAARYTLQWAVGCAALISLGYAVAGELMIRLLTDLPEVRQAAGGLLPWAVALPLAGVLAFHLDGVFIGTTRSVWLRNSMFAAALVFLLVLWLSLDPLGNAGLWLSMLVFLGFRGLLLASLYPRLERLAAQR